MFALLTSHYESHQPALCSVNGGAEIDCHWKVICVSIGAPSTSRGHSQPVGSDAQGCRLLFGEYVYQLPDRLEPGDEIDILGDDLREQTTRSYLNRRSKDSEDANRARKIPWDPTSTRIERLAEILMFYSAAGGQEYTGLSHSYQPFADLTDHLQLSRAILVGKVDSLVTPLQIDGQSAKDAYDSTSTFVRLIFPVETR